MDKPFQAQAILNRISYTADGGLSLGFVTQELDTASKVIASEYHKALGWLCFKANEWQDEELPKSEATDGRKSYGQRLRGVLYRLWEQGAKDVDFDTFYRRRMEALIDKIKEKLNG